MAALTKMLLTALLVVAAAFPQSPAHATHTGSLHMVCDVNGDGALDNFDFRAIQAARGSVATGPSDPRDPNRDGVIEKDDHRICVLRPMCLRQLSLKHRSPAACGTQPVNRPPVADAGADQSVFTGSVVTLNGSGSSDPDGDALTFSWRILSAPAGSAATLSDPGAIMPTFLADEDGQFVIELIVNDGELDSSPDTVTINTQPTNTPPVADAGPDQTVIVGATVTLDGSGSADIDGDSLTFTWSFASLPAGSSATLSDASAVNPTFIADIAGEFIVQLIVNDGQEDSAPDAVSIFSEQGNRAPIADAGPDQSADVGDTITLDGSGSSDPDGDALMYSWSFVSQPAGSTATISSPDSVIASFMADEAGQYVVQLIVNDGSEDSEPDTALINIEIGNTPPVADAGPDQTATVGDTVLMDGNGSSDADGDALGFTWSFTSRPPGSQASLSDPSAPSTSFVADVAGLYVVQLIVNDGTVDSAPDTANVTVEAVPNRDPAAVDDAATTDEDTAVDIDVLANDSDTDGDLLSVSSVTQPLNGSVTTDGSLVTYTPAPDFNGTDSFVYTISDDRGGTASATVTVEVAAVNDAPVAVDDSAETTADTPVTVAVLANDTDVDGDTLTVAEVTNGTNGTVSTDGTTVTYTPAAGFVGLDSFTYTASDGDLTDTATVTVNVLGGGGGNLPPVAVDDTATTDEDTPIDIDVLANDTDADGDPLTITEVTQPTNGTVANNDTDVSYTPNPDFNGPDTFTYTISDGTDTATATVTVTVTPVNDAPVAVDDSAETTADTPVTVAVLANDTDVDGDTLTVAEVTNGTNGTVSTDGTTVTYAPAAGFVGLDSFTYTASDGALTDTATVTVNVLGGGGGNLPPVAVDDTATTAEDTPIDIDVLANDTDADGDSLTITEVTQPANGAVLNNDTDVSYTPNPDFNGTDTFTYTIGDGVETATATVIVTVTPVNDAPVAVDDSADTSENTPVTVAVLANDTDVDGDALSVAAVTDGANGTVTTDGTNVTYTPDSGFSGIDGFTYTVSDGDLTDTATVTVDVGAVNDPPIATDDEFSVEEDSGTTVLDVLGNDSDPDGDPLTVSSVTQPANGTATNTGTGVSYTPATNFNGTDTFTYTVSDGVESASATVTMTVTPVNDAPLANDDSAGTDEDTSVTVAVLANDTDVDGDPLTVTQTTDGTNGTVTTDGTTVTYTPDPGFNGSDSFTYTVSDGELSDTATVAVDVAAVNDPPVANDDAVTVAEDSGTTVLDVLANDADPDGDMLTISVVTQPANGAVTNAGSSINYAPGLNFNGTDTFTYTVSDGTETDGATVTVTVTAVNDAPVAINDQAQTDANQEVTIAVLANDQDIDGDTLTVSAATQPSNGTVVNNGSDVTYTPNTDFSGTDTFTYTASDGALQDTANVIVTVTSPLPIVTLTATDTTMDEEALGTGEFTLTRSGGNLGATLRVFYSTGGSASPGSDYDAIGGFIDFPANVTVVTRTVTPRQDNLVEPEETVTATLSANAAYNIGVPSSGTITLADFPAVVTLEATDTTMDEEALGTGEFTLTRSGGNLGATLRVFYSTGGSASPGSDYDAIGGFIDFPANVTVVTRTVTPRRDNLAEPEETVTATLSANAAYNIGVPSSGTITLSDDPVIVNVQATDANAAEEGTDPGEFTFTRSGGDTAATLRLFYAISGTATNGTDYTAIAGFIDFAANSTTTIRQVVPVDDASPESSETVTLTISANATYSIGVPSNATVTIVDND